MGKETQPDLFAGTAYYYARFRAGYPDDLIRRIAERFGREGRARALDLGAGTGQLAVPLARHLAEVVAADPDAEMRAEGHAAAARLGVENLRFVQGSSRTLPELNHVFGPFDLVTMASSFHWMEQDTTLAALDRALPVHAGVVLAGNGGSVWSGAESWKQAAQEVIQRWLGKERRAGSGTYREPRDRFEAVLARSAFSEVEEYHRQVRRSYALDQVVGLLYSSSYASPALFGVRLADFEADLRGTLEPLAVNGRFVEEVVVEGFLASRPDR